MSFRVSRHSQITPFGWIAGPFVCFHTILELHQGVLVGGPAVHEPRPVKYITPNAVGRFFFHHYEYKRLRGFATGFPAVRIKGRLDVVMVIIDSLAETFVTGISRGLQIQYDVMFLVMDIDTGLTQFTSTFVIAILFVNPEYR